MPIRMGLLAPRRNGGGGGMGGRYGFGDQSFTPSFSFDPTPTFPTPGGSGAPWWATILNAGVGALGQWLGSRGQGSVGSNLGDPGTIFQADQAGIGAIVPQLARYGLIVAGSIIRGTKAMWTKVPALLKAAAAALGLTFIADTASELLFGGNGDGSTRRRRGRGITATELRGFNKVGKLLRKVGMRPKVLGGGSRFARKCK